MAKFDNFWDWCKNGQKLPDCTTVAVNANKLIIIPPTTKHPYPVTNITSTKYFNDLVAGNKNVAGYFKKVWKHWLRTTSTSMTLLPKAPTLSKKHIPTLKSPATRTGVVEALVRWIQNEPYQLIKKEKGIFRPHLSPVRGWDERLKLFSYAKNNKTSDYVRDYFKCKKLLSRANTLQAKIKTATPWTAAECTEAVSLTKEIFKWGGVGKRLRHWNASTVRKVFEASLRTKTTTTGIPINSSWTKVAAFASGRNGQVIWDSRVAMSLVWRLDSLLGGGAKIRTTFPDLGPAAPATSGTRSMRNKSLMNKWPSTYQKWSGQYAGTAIANQIVKILNNKKYSYPQMPIPDGKGGYTKKQWDVWGVGQVLFMDGY